ncbi:hypothetical protein CY34DRAFT_382936 [Suillus luteus UH-Slu-Lm8-n1]|uniref:Uncharacterized protein n=1 Tax=Suillus luteus UH-Slu-Lm8-n1 TaxID=930992 RepID=A0A0D0B421_9AGAM|nr:hypothetical protein CY34DRAFT_382936 [Suillus luteus UH-Slu-Lm8-n1]
MSSIPCLEGLTTFAAIDPKPYVLLAPPAHSPQGSAPTGSLQGSAHHRVQTNNTVRRFSTCQAIRLGTSQKPAVSTSS